MEFEIGQFYEVTVLKIIRTGIVVQVGDTSNTALIHLSRLSNKFVDKVERFIEIGTTYKAQAIKGKIQPIELSLLHLNLIPNDSVNQDVVPLEKATISIKSSSLDEMISKSNKAFNEKIQALRIRDKRNRRR